MYINNGSRANIWISQCGLEGQACNSACYMLMVEKNLQLVFGCIVVLLVSTCWTIGGTSWKIGGTCWGIGGSTWIISGLLVEYWWYIGRICFMYIFKPVDDLMK